MFCPLPDQTGSRERSLHWLADLICQIRELSPPACPLCQTYSSKALLPLEPGHPLTVSTVKRLQNPFIWLLVWEWVFLDIKDTGGGGESVWPGVQWPGSHSPPAVMLLSSLNTLPGTHQNGKTHTNQNSAEIILSYLTLEMLQRLSSDLPNS